MTDISYTNNLSTIYELFSISSLFRTGSIQSAIHDSSPHKLNVPGNVARQIAHRKQGDGLRAARLVDDEHQILGPRLAEAPGHRLDGLHAHGVPEEDDDEEDPPDEGGDEEGDLPVGEEVVGDVLDGAGAGEGAAVAGGEAHLADEVGDRRLGVEVVAGDVDLREEDREVDSRSVNIGDG